jgi:DNA-binding NarL/FixJ family response regulator
MRIFTRRSAGQAEPEVTEPGPEPEPEPEPTADAAASEPRPPVRVAVVDDDEDFRELIRLGLGTRGFTIVGVAADAAAAIDLVGSTQPDIVMLDLHMPDVGGVELLPLLRAQWPRAKFVAYSTIGATHMVERVIEAGFVGYIGKGVSIDSIAKHLDRVATMGTRKLVRPFPLGRDYD